MTATTATTFRPTEDMLTSWKRQAHYFTTANVLWFAGSPIGMYWVAGNDRNTRYVVVRNRPDCGVVGGKWEFPGGTMTARQAKKFIVDKILQG